MDKEGENVIVCGIALGLAVLGWAVSRKWGRKDWQKGAAVIAAAACLGLLSGYMELQTDEDPEKGLLRRENGERSLYNGRGKDVSRRERKRGVNAPRLIITA